MTYFKKHPHKGIFHLPGGYRVKLIAGEAFVVELFGGTGVRDQSIGRQEPRRER